MASEVQICNLALNKFGNISITSLEDATKEARACKVFYPLLRDEMLYEHPWNFAMKRADISAQLSDTPDFGYDYAYQLPADCLRVWELSDSDAEWEVESGELLVSQSENIYIRYIRKVTEAGRFSPSFVNCLGLRLAAELCTKLSDNKTLRETLLTELYKVAIPAAHRLNALEGNKKRHKDSQQLSEGNYSWQTEGR